MSEKTDLAVKTRLLYDKDYKLVVLLMDAEHAMTDLEFGVYMADYRKTKGTADA